MRRRRLGLLAILAVVLVTAGIYLAHRVKAELAARHRDRGGAAAGLGDLNAAIREYQAAIRLDPRMHNAREALAALYDGLGDHTTAIRELQAGVRADPRSLIAHENLAFAHFRAQEYDKAMAAYRTCLRLDPDNTHWRVLIARCAALRGDTDTARHQLEGILAIEPDNDAARRALRAITTNAPAPSP